MSSAAAARAAGPERAVQLCVAARRGLPGEVGGHRVGAQPRPVLRPGEGGERLVDTVERFDPTRGTGTGFVFRDYDVNGLLWAVDEALAAFARRQDWERLRANAMAADFSWELSARRYADLYRSLGTRGVRRRV